MIIIIVIIITSTYNINGDTLLIILARNFSINLCEIRRLLWHFSARNFSKQYKSRTKDSERKLSRMILKWNQMVHSLN